MKRAQGDGAVLESEEGERAWTVMDEPAISAGLASRARALLLEPCAVAAQSGASLQSPVVMMLVSSGCALGRGAAKRVGWLLAGAAAAAARVARFS